MTDAERPTSARPRFLTEGAGPIRCRARGPIVLAPNGQENEPGGTGGASPGAGGGRGAMTDTDAAIMDNTEETR
jgi:hypothetical protein